ncbi:DUF423 domain-containing protein [Aureimonas ureilytica]|uniref:DUF423 domain-containing protein n=1 Tax=Aureimonas ureilytica TaxID=401562 RepID=UPI00038004F4|nr:DUF423 domain-containing protein [Aureimonas ureilytica]
MLRPHDRLALVCSGLFGAAGTGGAAYAAHGGGDASLAAIAAAIAFVHAPALLALGLAGERLRGSFVPVLGMIVGVVLFSGDLAMRLATGGRLFAMAAPTGGSVLILSWLAVAVLALLPKRARTS